MGERGRGARSESPPRRRRERSRSSERHASSSCHDSTHKKDKKHKRKKEKKSKKAKDKKHTSKKRKRRRHESDESSGNSSDNSSSDLDANNHSGDDDETLDLERAAVVVRTLLLEFPSIAPDLLALLQQLDDGGAAVISGIANARVKALLGSLFPLLGLKKCRRPADSYVARSRGGGLLEMVAGMLTSTEQVEEPPMTVERRQPIGPARPPTGAVASVHGESDDDDDDDVVGPALPGMKGFRFADKRVEAEMARRAQEMEEDAWRRARGEPPLSQQSSQANARQEWMTQMPTNNKLLADAMGPAMMKPSTGKPAAFRSKEPAAVDDSWFASPEERERAKRAKLDMDLLGYVRPENAPSKRSDSSAPRVVSSGVNESILPAANPEADREMREQMNLLREKRGPSLLEQHQQKVAAQQAKTAGDAPRASTWNRDRDLTARRGLSKDDADRIIKSSQEISSKFTAPSVTRQFL